MTFSIFAIEITFSPLIYVDCKHEGIDEGAAERSIFLWTLYLGAEAVCELLPDCGWNDVSVGGIDIGEEDERPMEQLPMRSRQLQKAVPVKVLAAFTQQVGHISTVKPF